MAGPKTGFVVPVRTAEITFQGTDYDGAVVECLLDVSLDWFFEVQRAVSGGDTEENEKMITAWADLCLIAWNLTEEDGTPIPCDTVHFLAQPSAFTTTIMQEWQKAAVAPAAPLSRTSINGDSSGAARFINDWLVPAFQSIKEWLGDKLGPVFGGIKRK